MRDVSKLVLANVPVYFNSFQIIQDIAEHWNIGAHWLEMGEHHENQPFLDNLSVGGTN